MSAEEEAAPARACLSRACHSSGSLGRARFSSVGLTTRTHHPRPTLDVRINHSDGQPLSLSLPPSSLPPSRTHPHPLSVSYSHKSTLPSLFLGDYNKGTPPAQAVGLPNGDTATPPGGFPKFMIKVLFRHHYAPPTLCAYSCECFTPAAPSP